MSNIKSTVPVHHGVPNPSYDRVTCLMERTPEFRSIMLKIQLMKRNGSSFSDIKNNLPDDIRTYLKQFYAAFSQVPDTKPVMGPPPPTRELYGRFATSSKIIDVGSGNGSKLARYTGKLRITCVDPNLDMKGNVCKQIKRDIAELLPTFQSNVLLSSFMSLCQIPGPVQYLIAGFDGLHIMPDHDVLLTLGIAERKEGISEKLTVQTIGGDYEDYPVVLRGVDVCPGYQLVPTYYPREIQVTLDATSDTVDYKPYVQAGPIGYDQINPNDISMKVDGEPFELEMRNGSVYLVNRAGLQYSGSSDFKEHVCLHLERMENCYVLLRVVLYRGFIPPHSYEMLKLFTSRVKFKIGDFYVFPPPEWSETPVCELEYNGEVMQRAVPTDGLITRLEQHDYYVKHQWTVDITPDDLQSLSDELKERGMVLNVEILDGLHEYSIVKHGSVVTLVHVRERTDKLQSTKLATVLYMISQKTLPEINALQT